LIVFIVFKFEMLEFYSRRKKYPFWIFLKGRIHQRGQNIMQPDDAITLTSLFSHSRKLYTGETLFYYPYGNATSKNILENYLGTPEIYTNVIYVLKVGNNYTLIYLVSI